MPGNVVQLEHLLSGCRGLSLVEWCPKCNAQLPPGLEKCPRCGAKLRGKQKDEYTFKDILWLTAAILGIVLLPVLVIIGIVWLILR
jgi:ribosomal protein L40E